MEGAIGLLLLLIILFPVVVLIWLVGHGRRLKVLESAPADDREQLRRLTVRVHVLEDELRILRQPAGATAPVSAPPPKPVMAPVVVAPPPPPPPPKPVAPVVVPAEPEPAALPRGGSPAAAWKGRSTWEWEAVVGGSWLNKLGGVVLVVGVALFLGYSAARVGPLGRVLIALAGSLALLATGIVIEARGRFRIFAGGLIGAGWAALYSTAYAMHSVEAARVIADPLTGAALLMAVAVGMIVHSLRYRSETVTGVAYAAAYVSLAITPVNPFSVLGLFPVTASLLVFSARMRWHTAALLSLAATYLVCATRESHGTPLVVTMALIGGYWLVFEIYDLVRSAQHEAAPGRALAIWPLNAAAALLLTYLKWHSAEPQTIHWLLAGAGALFLASAIVRGILRSSYVAPVTVSAALLAWACLEGFSPLRAVVALAIEAEAFFVAGLVLRAEHLRRVAAAVFGVAAIALGAEAARTNPDTWTPYAGLLAALFYLNRALRRPGLAYSWAASMAVAVIVGFEAPAQYLGLAWLGFAAILFEFGVVRRLEEFRYQGYTVGAAAAVALGLVNAAGAGVAELSGAWQWLYLGAAGFFAATGQLLRPSERVEETERDLARTFCSWAGSLALAAALWHAVQLENLGLAWLLLAAALFELGLLVRLEDFRMQAYTAGLAAVVSLAMVNACGAGLATTAGQWQRLGVAALVFYGLALQASLRWPAWLEAAKERAIVRDCCATAGAAAAATMLWYALPAPAIALGWGALALALFEAGPASGVASFRAHSAILAGMTFARPFFGNFTNAGETAGISHRVLTVAPLIALFWYLWSRLEGTLARLYLYAAVILWAVLLRFELGRTLTVTGWVVTSLVLLALGLKTGIADLRFQSYALAVLTFVRSWNTNFYLADSLLGVPARVLTGAFVIAALYAGEFLAPRRKAGERGVHAYARLGFSLMATTLLAALIHYEVSGTLLTVGWGLQGAGLLVAGFALSERSLRLAGLALLLFCAAKLFVYDLREVEIVYRILSFVVLGLLLLGASWIYTRYRGQLRRYL